MRGIPPALETDTEDVTWALQTAEALWKRNERVDALVWLRRAAQAAGEAEHDDRALELAHDAAELAEWIAKQPDRRSSQPSEADETDVEETEVDEVEEVSEEVPLDSASSPREPMDTPTEPNEHEAPPDTRSPRERVPSAAEKHAGMLDPWAESEVRAQVRSITGQSKRPTVAAQAPETDEVVTSAPPIERRGRLVASRPTPPAGTVRARHLASGIDLADVDALSDLPDDARDSFARAAVVREVSSGEEISGFALALVLEGSVDVAATIVDASAQTLQIGAVVRSRGTIDRVWPLRLVATSDGARIATWDEAAVKDAFRTCPWVEDDLRAAGDRIQALAGVTMGPLGERFDPMLRAQVASKLTLRVLAEHEIFATRGEPIPGLLIVGAGELELIGDERTPDTARATVRPGDFLFPNEVLLAGSAPSTVRSGKGGALVLFADRHLAQELLVTCPPLLEIFAGM
jgi:hypothetical protein